jgi:hypothetical protein
MDAILTHHLAPFLKRGFSNRFEYGHAGIVDQGVNPAERGRYFFNGSLDLLRIRHVAQHGQHVFGIIECAGSFA